LLLEKLFDVLAAILQSRYGSAVAILKNRVAKMKSPMFKNEMGRIKNEKLL